MRVFKILALQTGLILALLLVAEATLSLFLPVALDESIRKRYNQSIPGLKSEVVYDRNQHGLRTLSMTGREKNEGVVRVLCLGASTTEQTTQSTEDMWCSLLETSLAMVYSDKSIVIETAAFGQGGLRAVDTAVWLHENYDNIKPDIVVTLLGINDLSLNGGPGYIWRYVSDELRNGSSSLVERCQAISQICRRAVLAARRVRQTYQLSRGSVVEWHSDHLPARRSFYQSLPYSDNPRRHPDPIVEFENSVRWILGFLKERAAIPIVLGQPTIWHAGLSPVEQSLLWFPIFTPEGPVRADPSWLSDEMARYNLMQNAIANEFNVPYVDMDSSIPKSTEFFFDDCHFTDKGSALVAKVILPVVRDSIDRLLSET